MSDPEDSHMNGSSSSDDDDDEAMFPSELEQPGSTLDNDLAPLQAQSSGLSPPQSQDLHDAMDTGEASHDLNGVDHLTEVTHGIDQSNGNGWEPKSEFAKSAEMVHEPGSCWNNKKAREECQKAWNQIEDKNFSLKDFGDPFDENEEDQENGK